MSLGGVLTGAEALQGSVHAGGPHEASHGGEAAQMHSKNFVCGQLMIDSLTVWLTVFIKRHHHLAKA